MPRHKPAEMKGKPTRNAGLKQPQISRSCWSFLAYQYYRALDAGLCLGINPHPRKQEKNKGASLMATRRRLRIKMKYNLKFFYSTCRQQLKQISAIWRLYAYHAITPRQNALRRSTKFNIRSAFYFRLFLPTVKITFEVCRSRALDKTNLFLLAFLHATGLA